MVLLHLPPLSFRLPFLFHCSHFYCVGLLASLGKLIGSNGVRIYFSVSGTVCVLSDLILTKSFGERLILQGSKQSSRESCTQGPTVCVKWTRTQTGIIGLG